MVPDSWLRLSDNTCHALVYSAIRSMHRSSGGLYSRRDSHQIAEDLIDGDWTIPKYKSDNGNDFVSSWTKEQCWQFILRGLLRGVLVDVKM